MSINLDLIAGGFSGKKVTGLSYVETQFSGSSSNPGVYLDVTGSGIVTHAIASTISGSGSGNLTIIADGVTVCNISNSSVITGDTNRVAYAPNSSVLNSKSFAAPIYFAESLKIQGYRSGSGTVFVLAHVVYYGDI